MGRGATGTAIAGHREGMATLRLGVIMTGRGLEAATPAPRAWDKTSGSGAAEAAVVSERTRRQREIFMVGSG